MEIYDIPSNKNIQSLASFSKKLIKVILYSKEYLQTNS